MRRGIAIPGLTALVFLALAATGFAQGGPGGPGGPGPSGPRLVGIVEIATEAVPFTVELPGRAVAFEQADIRPRVGGWSRRSPMRRGGR